MRSFFLNFKDFQLYLKKILTDFSLPFIYKQINISLILVLKYLFHRSAHICMFQLVERCQYRTMEALIAMVQTLSTIRRHLSVIMDTCCRLQWSPTLPLSANLTAHGVLSSPHVSEVSSRLNIDGKRKNKGFATYPVAEIILYLYNIVSDHSFACSDYLTYFRLRALNTKLFFD